MSISSFRQHPLFHITEHLFGALAVFGIALAVALVTPSLAPIPNVPLDLMRPTEPRLHLAHVLPSEIGLYWDGASDNIGVVAYRIFKNNQLLAEQSAPTFVDSSDLAPGSLVAYTVAAVDASGNLSVPSETTYVVIPSGSSTDPVLADREVFFSVTPAPVIDCATGKPIHEVFFALSDPSAGSFVLSSPSNGVAEYAVEWGRQHLPNGTYRWKAILADGYTVSGPSSGEFLLSGNCDGGSTVVPSSTVATPAETLSVPVPQPVPSAEIRPTLRLFVDSSPVAPLDYRFAQERVELRVTAIKVKKVSFYAISGDKTAPIDLGVGVYDDLLSMKGTDVWSMDWETRKMSAGDYQVFARVLLLTGSTAETLHANVRIASSTDTPRTQVRTSTTVLPVTSSDELLITLSGEIRMTQVQDPASCTDVRSCRAFCSRGMDEQDRCLDFARASLFSGTSSRFTSLADGVDLSRLDHLLSDLSRRPKDLPDYVTDRDDFIVFCRDLDHAPLCTRVLERSDLASPSALAFRQSQVAQETTMTQRLFEERVGARAFVDSDGDHVADFDEINIYNTDPDRDDTDGDGFLDGEEIIVHTDPRGAVTPQPRLHSSSSPVRTESSEEVLMEDARAVGVPAADILAIRRVASVEVPGQSTSTRNVLRLSGLAPANSYVTLFVFSDPIVVTTRTNASGTWSYLLPRDLPDGSHEAVVAMTDAKGRVLARSATLSFVKEDRVVTLGEATLPPVSEPSSGLFVTVIALALALVGVGLSVVGLVVHRKHLHDAARVILPRTR